MDKLLKVLSLSNLVISPLRYVPVVLHFSKLGVLDGAIWFWADDFASLELKKESLSLIVKDLLIDIVDLVSLYKFDNIEIVVHQSFSFLK